MLRIFKKPEPMKSRYFENLSFIMTEKTKDRIRDYITFGNAYKVAGIENKLGHLDTTGGWMTVLEKNEKFRNNLKKNNPDLNEEEFLQAYTEALDFMLENDPALKDIHPVTKDILFSNNLYPAIFLKKYRGITTLESIELPDEKIFISSEFEQQVQKAVAGVDKKYKDEYLPQQASTVKEADDWGENEYTAKRKVKDEWETRKNALVYTFNEANKGEDDYQDRDRYIKLTSKFYQALGHTLQTHHANTEQMVKDIMLEKAPIKEIPYDWYLEYNN